jgi:hypothetical protein
VVPRDPKDDEAEDGVAPPKDGRGAAEFFVSKTAGARLDRVERIVPRLRQAVEHEWMQRTGTESYKRRIERQRRSLVSNADPRWPDAFFGPTEAAEHALQAVAGGARAALAVEGGLLRDPEAWEDRLTSILLNDIHLPLALEEVREPRPELQLPPGRGAEIWRVIQNAAAGSTEEAHKLDIRGSSDTNGVLAATVSLSDLTGVSAADSGLYRDWKILASAEQRTIPPRLGEPDSEATVYRHAAVEIRAGGDLRGLELPPLEGQGDARLWWAATDSKLRVTLTDLQLPALPIGVDRGGPALADTATGLGLSCFVMTPSRWLCAVLGLRPGPRALQLSDNTGPALALRTWRCGYDGGEYELARPLLSGAQVLARPDVLMRLVTFAEGKIAWRECVAGDAKIAGEASESR